MDSLLVTRLCCLFALLGGTVLFGLLPLAVRNRLSCGQEQCSPNCRCKRGKRTLAFLIFFGGGVLLGTTILHLLPEAREGFEKKDNTTALGDDDDGEDHETFSLPEFIVCLGFFGVYLFELIVHHFLAPPSSSPSVNNGPDEMTPLVGEAPCDHTLSELSVGALLTFAALSFHSLFEGFAVGLRPDPTSTLIVFFAVSVHKFALAFVCGLQLVTSYRRLALLLTAVLVFALASPIGMAIAMATAMNLEDSSPLTVSVLNAIATGTLLYVTFFEILKGAESEEFSRWAKFAAIALGFVVIALVQYGSTFA